MERSFQLPRTCEVIVEFLGQFQRIRKQDWEMGSRKSVHVTRAIGLSPPSVMQLVSL